jgi:GT2 family glycosyltransferase
VSESDRGVAGSWRVSQEEVRRRIFWDRHSSHRYDDAGAADGKGRSRPGGERLDSVSVVVAVRDGEAVLDRCLRALLDQDHPNLEVIVVDDGSRDGTGEVARRHADSGRVQLLRSGGRGAGAARNVGMRCARGDVLAFIDADGFADRGWLSAAVAALARDPTSGAVGSLVFFDASPKVINGAGATMDVRGYGRDHCFGEPLEVARLPREVLYTMACGMVCRRAALEQVGGFDEEIVHYYEDAELCIRLWRAGWRVTLAPTAWVDHGFGQSWTGGSRYMLYELGRIRTMLIHMPARALPRWLAAEAFWLVVPSELREGRRGAWRWNLRHLGRALATRSRWGRHVPAPRHLFLPGRAKLPEDPDPPRGDLLYGWYPELSDSARSFRWATSPAGLRLRVDHPARGVEIEYRTPPRSHGGALELRRPGDLEPLAAVELPPSPAWRRIELSAPLDRGDFEVVVNAVPPYEDIRRRQLAIAVAAIRPRTGP